ncbi:hypothetical protein, partial [Clostridioides difficile]|uniref:hypothetical protein n=1 Tax=Clostridioides difficile TaxID=1496 RepID=UPI0014318AD2
ASSIASVAAFNVTFDASKLSAVTFPTSFVTSAIFSSAFVFVFDLSLGFNSVLPLSSFALSLYLLLLH